MKSQRLSWKRPDTQPVLYLSLPAGQAIVAGVLVWILLVVMVNLLDEEDIGQEGFPFLKVIYNLLSASLLIIAPGVMALVAACRHNAHMKQVTCCSSLVACLLLTSVVIPIVARLVIASLSGLDAGEVCQETSDWGCFCNTTGWIWAVQTQNFRSCQGLTLYLRLFIVLYVTVLYGWVALVMQVVVTFKYWRMKKGYTRSTLQSKYARAASVLFRSLGQRRDSIRLGTASSDSARLDSKNSDHTGSAAQPSQTDSFL